MNTRHFFALTAALVLSASSPAATFSVINANASGAGSLQQAILDANANPGADTISFNLPTTALTITPTNALPVITEPITIDGSTQPSFGGAPIVEINGTSAGNTVDGLKLNTSNSVIRALIINRFRGDGIEILNGANNTIEGSYIGLNRAGLTDQGNVLNGILLTDSPNNFIGGLSANQRNYIAGNNQSGVNLSGSLSTNNLLRGNHIGLNINNAAIVNSSDGVRVNAPRNIIGGSVAGSRNIISGNNSQGIEITPLGTGTIVRGNYIGTDPAGALDRGNSTDGILVNAGSVIIGGSTPGEGNLISGNNSDGIELNGASATNNLVQGNIIGANASGSAALPNSGDGILITTSSRNNLVGGVLAGQANRIAFNAGDGINLVAAVANTNNAFRANSIFSNGDLGIDLAATGVTPNDTNDADTGANFLQNFPLLTAATNNGSNVNIAGTLNSKASTRFTLDFFATSLFDPSGHGEGEIYLGSTDVTTDTAGQGSFTISFSGGLTERYFTATATDPNGNTSEFSPIVAAQSTLAATSFTVINTADSGPGSFRQAILDANAAITVSADRINFAIPGTGPQTIALTSALPPISDSVIIDGYTQRGSSVNTLSSGNNAVLRIRIDGNGVPNNVPGLVLWAGDSLVRGLAITRFKSTGGNGIELHSDGNAIEGNFIGLSVDGSTAQGNGGDGILIRGANNFIGGHAIGGASPAGRNLIAGNAGDGIDISGADASSNVIQGNYIGTDLSGTLNRGNGGHGVQITSANNNTVGGLIPGEPNIIAYNGSSATFDGVFVASGTGNVIRHNRIFSNVGLGIDLGANGVTLNDTTEADTGGNQLQNFPLLTAVKTNAAAEISITGSLTSAANTAYALDFYANTSLDASGYGEGEFFLGAANLTTDGTGQVPFDLSFATALPGRYVTATATDPSGNTSEFGRWVVAVSSEPSTNVTVAAADFVFIIDASVSMAGEIAAVKNGLGSFVTGLNTNQISARFAIVLFGGPTEIILDFTTDQLTTESMFDLISVNGAMPGIHNNHNLNPEAGLEAIRIVLNAATDPTIQRTHVGGSGPLAFRREARKNLVLVTDENSDLPFYVANRQAGQSGGEPPNPLNAAWQAEVDATAQAVIGNQAFINLLINPGANPSRNQYGDPAQSVSDANFLSYDPEATLAKLITAGFGDSLEAQALEAGLVSRAFNITAVNTPNFIANFFAAKVEEIVTNPIPQPRLNIELIPNAVRLTWTTNSTGYLLETNRSLSLPAGWGVLNPPYSISGTNYSVTNGIADTHRFYRLRK